MATKDRTGYMQWQHGRTWFRVIGDLKSKKIPIVVMHGGPGSTHHTTLTMGKLLADSGRPVILYDQIGCGNSSPLTRKPASFWTVELFEEELSLILKKFKIENRYILCGTSWGGMLAQSFAAKRPKGLKGLILNSTLPSSRMWVQETRKLVAKMPAKYRQSIYKYEKLKKYTNKEYLEANAVFAKRHICRIPQLNDVKKQPKYGNHVYNAMWGPTEFTVTGSLHDWSVEKEITQINVPTFLISGSQDEAAPAMQRFIKSRIKGAQWHCIEGSAHLSYEEAPLEWITSVEKWLTAKKL